MESLSMSSSTREDTRLIQEGAPIAHHQRSTWVSMVTFLIMQLLIFTPEGFMTTLGIQFARAKFAAERNFTLPAGVNACAPTNESHELKEIQSATALFSTYQSFLFYFIPVVTGLPLTAVSDFTGRRPMMLLRCFGSLVMAGAFLIVSFFELSVYYTLIGCAFGGITGGFVFLHSVSMLYVTDIVAPKHRGVALAGIYGLEYVVTGLSSLVINVFLQTTSYTIVYFVTTCFSLVACLWMLPTCLVRESVAKRPITHGVFRDIFLGIRCLFASATNGRRWRIVVILACYVLVSFNMFGFQNTVNLYGLGEPFCWSPTLIGIFSTVYLVPNSIVAPIVVWLIELCLSDYWVVYSSIFSGIAEFVMTAMAKTNAVLIYGASLAGILFGLSQPVFIALLTRLVDTSSQGALFSLYTLVYAVTTASSITIQSYAYAVAVESGHAVDLFYVMTVLSALILVPTIVMHVLEPKYGFHPEPETHNDGER